MVVEFVKFGFGKGLIILDIELIVVEEEMFFDLMGIVNIFLYIVVYIMFLVKVYILF